MSFRGAGIAREPGTQAHGPAGYRKGAVFIGSGPAKGHPGMTGSQIVRFLHSPAAPRFPLSPAFAGMTKRLRERVLNVRTDSIGAGRRTQSRGGAWAAGSVERDRRAGGAVQQAAQVKSDEVVLAVQPKKRRERRHRQRVAGLELGEGFEIGARRRVVMGGGRAAARTRAAAPCGRAATDRRSAGP